MRFATPTARSPWAQYLLNQLNRPINLHSNRSYYVPLICNQNRSLSTSTGTRSVSYYEPPNNNIMFRPNSPSSSLLSSSSSSCNKNNSNTPSIHPLSFPKHQIRTMVMVTKTSATDPLVLQMENTPIIEQSTRGQPPSNTPQPDQSTDILVTASCAARVKQLASTRPNPESVYLRVFVDAGGCSGFQYKFLLLSEDGSHNNSSNNGGSLDEEDEDGTIDPEEDIIVVKDGARIVIDEASLELVRGSTIDYVQEMIRSSFAVIGNPQSESACGCGSSFAVKNFEANPALD